MYLHDELSTLTEEVWVDFPYPYLNIKKEVANKYKISSYGNIIKIVNEQKIMISKILNSHKSAHIVEIERIQVAVAPVVLYAFDPNPNYNNLKVIHIDGNNFNNKLSNLKWSDNTRFGKPFLYKQSYTNIPSEPGEIWLPVYAFGVVKDFLINGWYASNYGRIFVINYFKPNGIFLSPEINHGGYCRVSCRKISSDGKQKLYHIQLHRLILNVFDFNENYENLQVNHIDGNKLNNRLDNLEWCDRTDNMVHAAKNNLAKHGSDCVFSIYPVEMIYKVLDYYIFNKYNAQKISEALLFEGLRFNARGTIRLIYSGRYRLYDVIDYMKFHNFTCSKLFTKEQLKEIFNKAIIYNSTAPFIQSIQWIKQNTAEYVSACIIFSIISNNLRQFDYIQS